MNFIKTVAAIGSFLVSIALLNNNSISAGILFLTVGVFLLLWRPENLEKREKDILAREKKLEESEMRAAVILRNRRKEMEELQRQRKTEQEMEKLEENISKLHNVQIGIQDWIHRREKDELAMFEEIMRDIDKFQRFSEQNPELDGERFEGYIAGLLTRNGYENAAVTKRSHDYGGDVTAEKDGVKYVFQCKYYSSPVGIAAVQQANSARSHYAAHVAIVVTNNVFTTAAKLLAKETGVVLWDCSKVEELDGLTGKWGK